VSSSQLTEARDRVRSFGTYNLTDQTCEREAIVAAAVERALKWTVGQREYFESRAEDQSFDWNGAKSLFELAIMVDCHARQMSDYTTVRPLLIMLQSIRDGRDVGDRPIRSRTDLVFHAFLYSVLRHAGVEDVRQRELIQRAINARILEHVERAPHRIMEERLALEWGAFSHSLPAWEQLIENSILGRAPSPLHLDMEATYQITHVILFLFGFGATRASVQPGNPPELRRLLSALIITCCGEQHWDLVGELLLCWDCLEFEPGLIYERAWDAFLSQQSDDGSFPGPRSGSERAGRDHGKPPENWLRFLERYHTTLVAILAGDGCLRRLAHRPAQNESKAVPAKPATGISAVAGAGTMTGVEKHAEWLARLLDKLRERDGPQPQAACSILVGTWVCAALNRALLSQMPYVAARVAKRLRIVRKWAELPPALSIIAHAILSKCGIILPKLATFIRELGLVLDAIPAEDALSDLAFCEKRILLHQLGLGKRPTLLERAAVARAAKAMPLDGSKAALEKLLLCLGSATGYGTRMMRMSADEAWVGELLSGLTVRFFRSSDIFTACTLLRNMTHLGLAADGGLTELIDFLLLQHRPEGGYGFFGAQEVSVMAASNEAFFADRDLYLPVTLSCLWTLAEATAGWSLYRSVHAS
jgi:hypothetical protein